METSKDNVAKEDVAAFATILLASALAGGTSGSARLQDMAAKYLWLAFLGGLVIDLVVSLAIHVVTPKNPARSPRSDAQTPVLDGKRDR